ncbi:MAG TPA: penicillin acylase family protein [Steroidobacteraceae bacterium]|nr:penicillin acylase family protein [Steroidobacteraceae bacterium]
MRVRSVAIALLVLILALIAVFFALLSGSLPRLDGDISVADLAAPVTIDRDALGVPTVTAATRTDLAYATGFLHGQDRFFEMDLSRRLAAGELSEIVGPAALAQDEAARIFRFRQVAKAVLEQATPEQRAILDAYTRGVNDGLASLQVRPWEYLALRARAAPWRPEDSVLVLHAMWWQLQYMGFHREMLRREVNDRLGGPLCGPRWKCALQFFYPARTPWDAPAVVPEGAPDAGPQNAAIPGPDVLDLRDANPPPQSAHVSTTAAVVGSNNWAVAGSHTRTGAALVANDMHLGQRVPVIWYRMRFRTNPAQGLGIDLTGVTLPGAPVMVAGSNGHIAWGFTNSYGNWLDVSLVPCTAVGVSSLTGPSGTIALQVQWELIRVHGRGPVRFPVRSGPGGVLLEAHPDRGQCWFASWLAQVPAASNFNLLGLEHVSTVQQALALAPTIGIPHQNFVVGDREGHIGWALYGRVPATGLAGPRIPAAVEQPRAAGSAGWLEEPAQPTAIDPPVGRLWTANARVTSDPEQERAIGGDTASLGAEYDFGARASQIRADLLAINRPATPADMLRIQLDDRAVLLGQWREVLLGLLDASSLSGHPARAQFRSLIEHWDAAADTDSVGYRLVRRWRDLIEAQVWDMILDGLHIPADASYSVPTQFQAPLLRLLQEQPLHLLAPRYASWQQLMLTELDAAITQLQRECGDLSRCTWGQQNTIRIEHPLSRALPFLSALLDMPTLELPGDHDMPRVQGMTLGSSERFAVSPGHEADGYFHMPGGQSGNPLSPYYRAGFMAWARGVPLPFLPGPRAHRITLHPVPAGVIQ